MIYAVADLLGISEIILENPDLLPIALALTCCLALLFVVVLVDFLARILSRFIPRWNRNL